MDLRERTIDRHRRSEHGVFLGHHRRYDPDGLLRMLENGRMDLLELLHLPSLPMFTRAIDLRVPAFCRSA